jgi:hypothetical protein
MLDARQGLSLCQVRQAHDWVCAGMKADDGLVRGVTGGTVYEKRVLDAIETITAETGYPPDAEELAAALGVSPRQIHSALMSAKRRGDVRYAADAGFVAVGLQEKRKR